MTAGFFSVRSWLSVGALSDPWGCGLLFGDCGLLSDCPKHSPAIRTKAMNNALLNQMNFIPKPNVLSYDVLPIEEEALWSWVETVPWTVPQQSRGRVDAAGIALLSPAGTYDRDAELSIMNNWRSAHSYPLQIIKMTLSNRAKKIQADAIVAQRLKRLSSIEAKLARNLKMKLSQMQDIGGCRAVLDSVDGVNSLVQAYETGWAKNPKGRCEFLRKKDYIASPKSDGYRSIHLVYKYGSPVKHRQVYNGLRIEIQLRSRFQHAWATAVETVSTFTSQALKSNVGSDSWKRFFALMGSAIAMREGCPSVPGTPTERKELVTELRKLSEELRVKILLTGWNVAVTSLIYKPISPEAHTYLLVLDANKMDLKITAYRNDQLITATEEYLRTESETSDKPEIQAVLVSLESLEALRSAYPNYYADTGEFLGLLSDATEPEEDELEDADFF